MPYASTAALSTGSNFTGRPHGRTEPSQSRATILLALGIVYGDLGTSPLYTLQTIVQRSAGVRCRGRAGFAITGRVVADRHHLDQILVCSSCGPTITAKAASWR